MGWQTGAGTVAGASIGAIASGIGGKKSRALTKELYFNSKRHATKMSNTAHYRESRDLKRAGLNRILGLSGGGAAQPQSGTVSSHENIGATTASTAKEAAIGAAQLLGIHANTAKVKAETAKVIAETPKEIVHGKGWSVINDMIDTGPAAAKGYYEETRGDIIKRATPYAEKRKRHDFRQDPKTGRWHLYKKNKRVGPPSRTDRQINDRWNKTKRKN